MGRAVLGVPARRARCLRRRVRVQRELAVRGVGRLRLGAARRGRLAALLERPLELDAIRLDLGPLRALGLGCLALRELGLLPLPRLVLVAGRHLGPGVGELGGRRRLRRLVPDRPAWPPRSRRGRLPRPRGAAGTPRSPRRVERGAPGRHRSARRAPPAHRPRGHQRLGAIRAADSAALRPTRDARTLREGDAVPRAISRRPTPGDFVRELGVDNKTTIPAPWTRGFFYDRRPGWTGRATAFRGAPTARTTDPPRTRTTRAPASGAGRPAGRARGLAAASPATESPRTVPAHDGAPRGRDAGRRRARAPSAGAESRPGSAWGTRRGEEPSARVEAAERTKRNEPSSSDPRRRSEGEGSSGYQPPNGGESSSRYRPRSESESSSAYRPRSGGGASRGSRPRAEASAPRPPRNEGGGSHARPTGGGSSGSSSSGHAAAPPRRN